MAPSHKNARKPAALVINKKQLKSDKKKKKENRKMKMEDDECTTPKAHKYTIPENLTCPKAPKKQKLVSTSTTTTPMAFFNPPDIEFFFASHMNAIYGVYTRNV